MASPLELKDAFAAISAIPLSTLQDLLGNVIKEFVTLQSQLQSGDEKEREEATQQAIELKKKVRDLLVRTYKDAGVDLATVAASLKQHLGQ